MFAAIKVGRPPSKKENARHHPYGGQINLSTSHIDSNPKLVYNSIGGYVGFCVFQHGSQLRLIIIIPAALNVSNMSFYSSIYTSLNILLTAVRLSLGKGQLI